MHSHDLRELSPVLFLLPLLLGLLGSPVDRADATRDCRPRFVHHIVRPGERRLATPNRLLNSKLRRPSLKKLEAQNPILESPDQEILVITLYTQELG